MQQPFIASPETFDLILLGCGTASKLAAWDHASAGHRVAVIERHYIGGSCPNIACLPSKNVIYTAQVASYARRLGEFGMRDAAVEVDMAGVRERKRAMVQREIDQHLAMFQKTGAELIWGEGRFVGDRTIEVTMPDGSLRRLKGSRVVIGTGSQALIANIPGLRESKPLTHIEALELDTLPEHLVILGGGFVGLEFAQAMQRLGSRVTLIEHNGRLLHGEDEDVSEGVQQLLCDEGVRVCLSSKVIRVSGRSGERVIVTVEGSQGEEQIEATHILVAAGRQPNTSGLGLESAGVALTADGFVQVNEKLETSAAGVWAVGEVAGSPQFTHVSEDDYRVFRAGMFGKDRTTSGRLIPYCLFTEPELARVGLSELQAKEQGVAYRLFKVPMSAVLRARAIVETRGFMKALVAADDTIVGFTAFGVNAGDLMGAVQLAMLAKLPYTTIRDAILAHPTMVEGLGALFGTGLQDTPSVAPSK